MKHKVVRLVLLFSVGLLHIRCNFLHRPYINNDAYTDNHNIFYTKLKLSPRIELILKVEAFVLNILEI